MDTRLLNDIKAKLDRDFLFKTEGSWLRKGLCPNCKKKSVYAHAETPWVLKCERLNNCGTEYHVKELYPELFDSWSNRFEKTPDNPNAAADAYLHEGRGFDLGFIRGWYVQETYYSMALNAGSATVRFPLATGYWERIIDKPQRFEDRKANFSGSYRGTWWQAPTLDTSTGELWLVEGIFDAIALLHHGISAVSLMSCNNYPTAALIALAEQCVANAAPRPRLVFGLDSDKAGQEYARRWVERASAEGWQASAALIPKDKHGKVFDWNDMHQRGRLSTEDIEIYRYLGALLIAATPSDKAMLMVQHNPRRSSFHFEFHNSLYWFELNQKQYDKAVREIETHKPELGHVAIRERALAQTSTVTEILNCFPKALYYQASPLTGESWYYFRVDFPHDGPSVKDTFTGLQTTTAGEFKKRLVSCAPGAVFTGTNAQVDALMRDQLFGIKTVQTLDFIGYSQAHAAWVFPELSIKGGKLYALNEEDYFDMGRLSVKSLGKSVSLSVNTNFKAFRTDWVNLIWRAYGAKGIVSLAYWFGSFFAEQIRSTQQSYPFAEIVGEPYAGKSTLLEFLWKLCGRPDYEGFDPNKATLAGRSRNFAQVANLPVVLTESDRDGDEFNPHKAFDWDELKTCYNGGVLRARGIKNSGNETYEPLFRAAIVISQNRVVVGSEALLSRIVHLYFDRATQNEETKIAADQLARMPIDAVSGFLPQALLKEADILKTFEDRKPIYEKRFEKRGNIGSSRVRHNHAQIMALVDCLHHVIPITDEQRNAALKLLSEMAVQRQDVVGGDQKDVREFWDIYHYLESEDLEKPILNHSRKPDRICINLNHFAQVLVEHKLAVPDLLNLRRVLKTSRKHKFIDIGSVNSAINARGTDHDAPYRSDIVKCWIFEAPKERAAA